ncbi:hypothetical protein RUM43_003551 [Polyplax serrata]|uniref:Ribosomal protein L27 n=1 Tax=Polyplax serrata TaxID=468196 RepID=A0AAN8Q130_POLSC
MAAYLQRINLFSQKFAKGIQNFSTGTVRYAKVSKSGTSKPRKVNRDKRKDFGVRIQDGSFVNPGTILVRQRHLHACPGLNVGIGFIADLYAKVAGKVVVTYEKTNLKTDNYLVFTKYPDSLPLYKTYYNVIPAPQHQRFKLVETI